MSNFRYMLVPLLLYPGDFLQVLRFPPPIKVSSTNKTDRHDITEILLKVALNTINETILSIHCPYLPSF